MSSSIVFFATGKVVPWPIVMLHKKKKFPVGPPICMAAHKHAIAWQPSIFSVTTVEPFEQPNLTTSTAKTWMAKRSTANGLYISIGPRSAVAHTQNVLASARNGNGFHTWQPLHIQAFALCRRKTLSIPLIAWPTTAQLVYPYELV